MSKDTRPGGTASRESGDACAVGRRSVIQGLAVSGCLAATGFLGVNSACAQASKRLQPGQRFAFMTGDKEGQPVTPADVKLGEPPLLVYPMDAATKAVISSRATMLLLKRVDEADLDPSTKPHAAGGIVAYSAICTHEGCPISGRHETPRMAVCNCHGSTFDLGNNGTVAHGPAVRRLALLPVTIADGELVVAGKLNGPIGPPT